MEFVGLTYHNEDVRRALADISDIDVFVFEDSAARSVGALKGKVSINASDFSALKGNLSVIYAHSAKMKNDVYAYFADVNKPTCRVVSLSMKVVDAMLINSFANTHGVPVDLLRAAQKAYSGFIVNEMSGSKAYAQLRRRSLADTAVKALDKFGVHFASFEQFSLIDGAIVCDFTGSVAGKSSSVAAPQRLIVA